MSVLPDALANVKTEKTASLWKSPNGVIYRDKTIIRDRYPKLVFISRLSENCALGLFPVLGV